MSPQRPDFILSSNIPDVELDILVCDSLDVEANCGDGGYGLVELELVEDCCYRLVISDVVSELWLYASLLGRKGRGLLVFPAASSPSISKRISLEPKSLPIIFETCPPIVKLCR